MGALAIGRYERKYVVTETTAAAVRQFVSAYMIPDPYMDPSKPLGYQVHSLYLDGPDLALYRHTTQGLKNRFKLRIRFYDESESSPAFLEVKKRVSLTMYKQRATVSKDAAENLLCGQMPGPGDLVSRSDEEIGALGEFCALHDRWSAAGSAFVSYQREAYVLPHAEGARVTLDRDIVSRAYDPRGGLTLPNQGETVSGNYAVLELKYKGRAPGWMKDLVRSFGLVLGPYPKYVHSVDALRLAPALAG